MKRKIPLIVLCILFAGITLYFGLGLYRQWQEYRAGEETYEALSQYVQPKIPARSLAHTAEDMSPDEPAPAEEVDGTIWPVVDFESLRAINPDIVAWIYIEGTNINYPVVQSEDNNYYINRLFDGKYSKVGSIFMDYRNPADMSGRNTVLYGHNMQDGTMFNQINNYKEQAFCDQHPTALLITPDKNYRIEFVAGYITDMNSDAWKMEFASDEEFSLWMSNAMDLSTFTGNLAPLPQDRVVTFSTCTYEFPDARYVLVGILK